MTCCPRGGVAGGARPDALIPRPHEPRIRPLDPQEADAEAREQLDRSLPGPDGGPLNIFRTLANHPQLMRRWMSFGTALLLKGVLPARDRELLILRTGWNCRSEYEWGQHAAIARATGMSDGEIARVADGPEAAGWEPFDVLLLRAADELHADACVSDATWTGLRERYDERAMIEVVFTVGQYHLVSFFLNSAGVRREPGVEGLPS